MSDDSERQEVRTFEDDLVPHAKQNMTSSFGRLVERISYVDIIILAGLVLVASTLWFWLGPQEQTLRDAGARIFDCAYFTLVTFTSLGYGELVPIGFGRAVAIFDVFAGLVFTAIFIGTVASERQSSLLLLLHTSDTQRRISDFSAEIDKLRLKIQSIIDENNIRELNIALESHLYLTRAIGNYLVFNAHQAAVLEFGNFTALIGLYDEIKESFEMFDTLHASSLRFGDVMVMRRFFSNMTMLNRIVSRMGVLHRRTRNQGPLWKAVIRAVLKQPASALPTAEQSAQNRLAALQAQMDVKMEEAREWIAIGHHPIQIERVFDAFPEKPKSEWPTGIHKTIAARLKISNSVATHCITDLLNAKRLPKT